MRQNSVRFSLLSAARRICRRAGMAGVVMAGTCAGASAATITEWTFQSDAIAQNNNPAADTGTGTASSTRDESLSHA